ncbi:MAG: flippase [Bacteroidetes bacterium]|nr:flippase [Bacteroidota bacterium]
MSTLNSAQEGHNKRLSSIAKNTFIVGVGTIYNYILVPFISVLTTRVLGAELYGIYSLAQSWGSLLANFSSLGFAGASYRLLPKYRAFGKWSFIKGSIKLAVVVASIVSLSITLFLLIAPNIFCDFFISSSKTPRTPESISVLHGAFRFYAISIFLTAVYLVTVSSLNGVQAIKEKVLANAIVGPTVKALTLVMLLALGYDLYAALLSNIFQDLAVLVVSTLFLVKLVPSLLDKKVQSEYEKGLITKFAGTLFVGQILNKYTFQLDVLLLGYFSTLAEVGIYSVALRLQPLVYLPHYTLASTFGPIVGELYAKGMIKELGLLYKSVTKWSFTASLLISSVILIFADEILSVFGKDFSNGLTILIILSVGNLIHDFLGIGNNLILMAGKVTINFYNSVLVAIINGVSFYFLIKHYGALGAAVGNFISMTSINLIILFEVSVIFKCHPFQWGLFKPLAAIAVASALSFLLKSHIEIPHYKYTFILFALIHSCVYVAAIYMLGLDSEDRRILEKVKSRLLRRKK